MTNRRRNRRARLAALVCFCFASLLFSGPGCSQIRARLRQARSNEADAQLPDEDEAFERGYRAVLSGNVDQAITVFEVLRDRPDKGGRRAPDALFWIGYCRERKGNLRSATERYSAVQDGYPDSKYSSLASERIIAFSQKESAGDENGNAEPPAEASP